jgi:hypothetical protein
LVKAFSDSTLRRVNDSTFYDLRGGRLASRGEGARWAATALNGRSVTFAPLARVRNHFVWRRESADAWTALLTWPAAAGSPARARTFAMRRWRAP